MALNSGAARSGLFSFKYSAALRLWDSICCCRPGLDCEKPDSNPRQRTTPNKTTASFVLMSRLYGGRAAFLVLPRKEKDGSTPPSFSFFRHASCQNEMRAFSWNCRGPIVVVVIVDELVGAPLAKATPVFGFPKLGWLKIL